MKSLKYIMIIWLAVATFAGRSQTIQMRIPVLTSTVGNFVDVPVYVDNSLTGYNVLSFQIKITYSSSLLN